MNYAYGGELAIVPYVKHEIVAIAPTHDSPITTKKRYIRDILGRTKLFSVIHMTLL